MEGGREGGREERVMAANPRPVKAGSMPGMGQEDPTTLYWSL